MAMDVKTSCQWRVTGGQPWNPTQAKTGLEWGTGHSLRTEISLPTIAFPGGRYKRINKMQLSTLDLAFVSAGILGFRHGFDYDLIAAISDITSMEPSKRTAMQMGF